MQYGKSQEAIDRLTAEQRRVTQEAGTERPPDGNPLPPGNVRARGGAMSVAYRPDTLATDLPHW